MSPLFIKSLRILKAKGWIVESWYSFTGNEYRIKLDFFMFAPPVIRTPNVVIELHNLKPSVIALGTFTPIAETNLYNWVKQVPKFALPFGQDLCDLCRSQGGDWFFSRCYCKGKLISFADGISNHCTYADAQVVTKEVRLQQLDTYFQKNPVAKRIIKKEFAVKDCNSDS